MAPNTKDHILGTTLTLLEREGGTAITLDRIAAEAGLSKGGLLYHFATKEQLVEALVDRAVGSLHLPPNERARDLFAALLAGYTIEPSRLQPLREAFRDLRTRLMATTGDPAGATSAWLAAEGLALFEYLGLVNLAAREKEKLALKISAFSKETHMTEPIAIVQPAFAVPLIVSADQHEQNLKTNAAREKSRSRSVGAATPGGVLARRSDG